MKWILITLAITGCCGEAKEMGTDSGTDELRCVDESGAVAPCIWQDKRCGPWYCGDETVCCPRDFAFGCGPNVCGSSEEACSAAGYGGECSNEMKCGISCKGTYPVACVVDRLEGPFWTCTDTRETCKGIPGEVCES